MPMASSPQINRRGAAVAPTGSGFGDSLERSTILWPLVVAAPRQGQGGKGDTTEQLISGTFPDKECYKAAPTCPANKSIFTARIHRSNPARRTDRQTAHTLHRTKNYTKNKNLATTELIAQAELQSRSFGYLSAWPDQSLLLARNGVWKNWIPESVQGLEIVWKEMFFQVFAPRSSDFRFICGKERRCC